MTGGDTGTAGVSRPTLLLLTADLFLGSRIRGWAESVGYQVRAGVSERALDPANPPDRVVIDLDSPRLDVGRVVAAYGAEAAGRVAAYAPHVRTDRLRAARAAGIAAVFTKSQLDAELPRWLSGAGR